MARFNLLNRAFILQPLFEKISVYKREAAKPSAADHLRLVKSGGLFILAVVAALLARETAESQGAESFLQQHWPSEEWLSAGLSSSGYEKLSADTQRETWIKWLHPSILDSGGFAEDLDRETLVIIDRPGSDDRIEVWKCKASKTVKPPKQWNHLGLGWAGTLQIKKCPIKAAILVGSRRNLVDPKEIRY